MGVPDCGPQEGQVVLPPAAPLPPPACGGRDGEQDCESETPTEVCEDKKGTSCTVLLPEGYNIIGEKEMTVILPEGFLGEKEMTVLPALTDSTRPREEDLLEAVQVLPPAKRQRLEAEEAQEEGTGVVKPKPSSRRRSVSTRPRILRRRSSRIMTAPRRAPARRKSVRLNYRHRIEMSRIWGGHQNINCDSDEACKTLPPLMLP